MLTEVVPVPADVTYRPGIIYLVGERLQEGRCYRVTDIWDEQPYFMQVLLILGQDYVWYGEGKGRYRFDDEWKYIAIIKREDTGEVCRKAIIAINP